MKMEITPAELSILYYYFDANSYGDTECNLHVDNYVGQNKNQPLKSRITSDVARYAGTLRALSGKFW
jgi:hypothetical protein